jgi:hypothetical protein
MKVIPLQFLNSNRKAEKSSEPLPESEHLPLHITYPAHGLDTIEEKEPLFWGESRRVVE